MTVPARADVAALPTGVDIAFETYGEPSRRPLLLIMGLGGPGLWWSAELCVALAERGFHVIRYDNRDVGRSTHFRDHRVNRGSVVRALLGRRRGLPYTMAEMADDGFGLLDHLGIEAAHVCGASMGGMIAQTMAIARPERVLSLVSMMSTTGRRSVGWQDPRLLPLLFRSRHLSREDYVAASGRVWGAIGSPGFAEDVALREQRAAETWDRGVDAAGAVRQMIAVVTQPDRTEALSRLRMPALVIHGTRDRMVHPSGGRATAGAIPGAELMMIPGMGHDLPPQLHEIFAEAIERTADRAAPSLG
ncbi:MAG: alpha/beta fold hydrolase, partial [Actinomycetota bacterium]|nr:alpha/beta fold hydrolase [Actinomycetota bacterium]